MDYRHADRADFDSELAIHGRVADSVAADSSPGSGLEALSAEHALRAPRGLP